MVGKRLGQQRSRARSVTAAQRRLREVADGDGDAPRVAQLSRQGESLLEQGDSAFVLRAHEFGAAQVDEGVGDVPAVSECPPEGKAFLEELRRAFIVGMCERRLGEVRERHGRRVLVLRLSCQHQALLGAK